MYLLAAIFVALSAGFTPWQSDQVIAMMGECGPPPFTAVIDAVIPDGFIAFTDTEKLTVYIDARRFEAAPNAFSNTLLHECGHAKGMAHDSPPIPGSIMSYVVREDQFGHVLEDAIIWAPPGLVGPPQPNVIAGPTPGAVTIFRPV